MTVKLRIIIEKKEEKRELMFPKIDKKIIEREQKTIMNWIKKQTKYLTGEK